VILLYLEAYSQDAGGFISENDQLFKVIDMISAHVGNKGWYGRKATRAGVRLYSRFQREPNGERQEQNQLRRLLPPSTTH
jgi:hypothetical protein